MISITSHDAASQIATDPTCHVLPCVAACRKVAITTEHVKQHIAKKPATRVEVWGAG